MVKLDNYFVAHYNPHLLIMYEEHINVEYCNKPNPIKYLLKYVNKGHDRTTIQISCGSNNSDKDKSVNEIKQDYENIYLYPCIEKIFLGYTLQVAAYVEFDFSFAK